MAENPQLREPLLYGLLRVGETMNIIAASKTGKSWLALLLAFAIATGGNWLGFKVAKRGRVLLIDNELHPETLADRLVAVATATGLSVDDYADAIDILPLRGALADINQLGRVLTALESGTYALVILDAFYRALPIGTDENGNGEVAALYNRIDQYAAAMDAAWTNIHHASKGNQSGRSVVDVGSGAGSQSRAADVHLVLRQHEQDGVVVLDAAVRSWAPIAPRCLRFEFPVWTEAEELDPAKLRQERPKRPKADKPEGDKAVREPPATAWTAERAAAELVGTTGADLDTLRARYRAAGLSQREGQMWIGLALAERLIRTKSRGRGRNARKVYILRPKTAKNDPESESL